MVLFGAACGCLDGVRALVEIHAGSATVRLRPGHLLFRPIGATFRQAHARLSQAPKGKGRSMDLTAEQKKTVLAAFLGWMLDAFDFFLLDLLAQGHRQGVQRRRAGVAYALFLTLAMRFIGAFIFGRLGDRWGRKPTLMLDILCYSIIGALAAFSPNLRVFLDPARPVRRRHGRRVGPWQLAGDGIDSPAGARDGVRHFARRLSDRLPARRDRLWPAVSAGLRRLYDRLAGDVPAQRPAGLRGSVHPRASRNRPRSKRRRRTRSRSCGRRSPSIGACASTRSC